MQRNVVFWNPCFEVLIWVEEQTKVSSGRTKNHIIPQDFGSRFSRDGSGWDPETQLHRRMLAMIYIWPFFSLCFMYVNKKAKQWGGHFFLRLSSSQFIKLKVLDKLRQLVYLCFLFSMYYPIIKQHKPCCDNFPTFPSDTVSVSVGNQFCSFVLAFTVNYEMKRKKVILSCSLSNGEVWKQSAIFHISYCNYEMWVSFSFFYS